MNTRMRSDGPARTRRAAVERCFQCLGKGDLQGFLDAFDAQVILIEPRLGNPIGHGSLMSSLQQLLIAFPGAQYTVEETVEGGDRTAVQLILTGVHGGLLGRFEATGRPVRIPMCAVFEWLEDRIVTVQSYWDQLSMLQQLGLA